MVQQRSSMESNWDDMAQSDSVNHNLTFASSLISGGASLTMCDMAPEATSSRRPSDDDPQVHTKDSLDVAGDPRAESASEARQRLSRHACDHEPQSWVAITSNSSTASSGAKGAPAAMPLGPKFRVDEGGIGQASRWWRQHGSCTQVRDSQPTPRRSLSAGDVRLDDEANWAATTQAQAVMMKPKEAMHPPSPGRQQSCSYGLASHHHQHLSSQGAGHPPGALQTGTRVSPMGDQAAVPLATQPEQGSSPLVSSITTLAGWPGSHSVSGAVAGQVVQPLQRQRGSGGLDGWHGSSVGSVMIIGTGAHEPAWPQTTGPTPAGQYSNSNAGRSGGSSVQSQSGHGSALRPRASHTPSEAMFNEAKQPSTPVERLAVLLSALPPDQPVQGLGSYPMAGLESLLHSTGGGMPASLTPGSLLHSTDSGRLSMQTLIASLAGLGYDTVSSSALLHIGRAVSSLPRTPSPENSVASHIPRTHSAGYTTSTGQVQDFGDVQECAQRHGSLTAPSTVRFAQPSPRPFNSHTTSSRLVTQHPQPLAAEYSMIGYTHQQHAPSSLAANQSIVGETYQHSQAHQHGQAHPQRGASVRRGAWDGQAAFLDGDSPRALAEEDLLLQGDAPHVDDHSMLEDLAPAAHAEHTATALAPGIAIEVTHGRPPQSRWGSGLLVLSICVVLLANTIAVIKIILLSRQAGSPAS